MSQPSVASYFNTRKRAAIEDIKIANARKVLLIDKSDRLTDDKKCELLQDSSATNNTNGFLKIVPIEPVKLSKMAKKVAAKPKVKKAKEVTNQRDIQDLFNNMSRKKPVTEITDVEETHRTPPSTPTKRLNAMDRVILTGNEPSLVELKKTLSRSSRLAELKASMSRFKESQKKLEQVEKTTAKFATSPSLKNFKTIELEVTLSPNKVHSPEKPYLSPRKDSSVRRNLLNLLSPVKNKQELPASPKKVQLDITEKSSLTLPFKYRRLAEMFRSIDTICQILYNRKETITFRKLKPAVEEMLKRNLYEKHLSQIKHLYPESFDCRREKLKMYGTAGRQEQWELLVEPNVGSESMTADLLLTRRRKFFGILIEKVKVYHNEFLQTLDPPLVIPLGEVKRWHPQFDIERVPDIECYELPQPPAEEKLTTGKEVLEKARIMFNCNTRMENALERLRQARENNLENKDEKPVAVTSVLKGIPKALLEKVRERQAAKALEIMTRTDVKDKEVQLYSRLPELARLTRNLFVAEKKSVLHMDVVVEKLGNSLRTYMTKTDLENHLRIISREVPSWLIFHEIRHSTFVKLSKNADLSLVLSKLETLATEKTCA